MDLSQTVGYVPGFPDTLNLRDLGGLVAADGRRVRRGLFYRGSALTGLSDEQKALVDGFGLRFLLDLRAAGEAAGNEEYVPEGCSYLRLGGMLDENGNEVDFSPAGIEQLMQQLAAILAEDPDFLMHHLYGNMMFGNPAVHTLVQHVVEDDVPLYFHCTAGKDRTGVCAAVLLSMLGVPDDAIMENFLLTNEYRASIINMPPANRPEHMASFSDEQWAKANGVDAGALRAALAAADERYGGREAYLLGEFGLDAETLARVRDRYLEA